MIGILPDGRRGVRIQQFTNTEVALEFKVCPVEQRIAQGVRHGGCPGQKLFIRRGIARTKPLGDAIAAHGAPFVVVPFQPDVEQVIESPVFRNVFGGKMRVVVEDGLSFRVTMIEMPGRLALQQEIGVYECPVAFSTVGLIHLYAITASLICVTSPWNLRYFSGIIHIFLAILWQLKTSVKPEKLQLLF